MAETVLLDKKPCSQRNGQEITLCDVDRRANEFQQLAPLVISRDPVGVLRILLKRERGELTLGETLSELEKLPMSRAPQPLSVRNSAKLVDAAIVANWWQWVTRRR